MGIFWWAVVFRSVGFDLDGDAAAHIQRRVLEVNVPDTEKCLHIVTTLQAKKAIGEVPIARVYDWDVHQWRVYQAVAAAKDV